VTLNINHIWQQPTISTIPAESAVAGSSTTNIAFTVGSVEVSTKNLARVWKIRQHSLVPNSPANIVFSGSGDSRFIQLFTIGSASGTAHITVFVTDNLETQTRRTQLSSPLLLHRLLIRLQYGCDHNRGCWKGQSLSLAYYGEWIVVGHL
jgi:hypothetical protein